jgi:hypothetical protein
MERAQDLPGNDLAHDNQVLRQALQHCREALQLAQDALAASRAAERQAGDVNNRPRLMQPPTDDALGC